MTPSEVVSSAVFVYVALLVCKGHASHSRSTSALRLLAVLLRFGGGRSGVAITDCLMARLPGMGARF